MQAKLEVRNLTKAYPGTLALQDFSAAFDGGKVYALLGKNGSGKSTFVKCLSGAVQPTSGQIFIDGEQVQFQNPAEASAQGIAVVYQELSLVLDFSVAENIFLARYDRTGPGGLWIDWEKTNARAEAVLKTLRIDIPVTKKVAALSVGQRQMIEIAKAMAQNPRVLILDEPTSALARHEIESLMNVVRASKDQGVAVIFITHKLGEIRGIADYATVLRDSRFVGSLPLAGTTVVEMTKTIVGMMFGDTKIAPRPSDLQVGTETALDVRNLTSHGKYKDVSFQVRSGEILGIAGMLGAGRTEVLRGIFGADPIDSGEVLIRGQAVRRPTIPEMKKRGLAMTPENRKEEGLVQMLSIRDNLCYASLDAIAKSGFITNRLQAPVVEKWTEALHIKTADPSYSVSSLSGGNQQKVVVGNWLNTGPSVVFFDEPSRGIDVQAKQQVFQIMWDLSRQGVSVVFVSSEPEELLEVCHRILIMEGGRIAGEVKDPAKVTLDELYALCMGESAS
jgi:ABC-type sugar transport system ATPase subunit